MTEPSFGDCRVVSELGSGSLSTIYKAAQGPLGRTVAVKALKSTIATSSPFAAHLEREARLLSELSHPNIATLYQFEKTGTQMYLVIEFVDGHSIARLLEKKPKVPAEVTAAIGAEIARGLSHAHERGIVHRDIKPANVLLSKRGDVKIVDFGIAQRERMPSVDEPIERTDEPSAFGTPAYMSPEQILGEFVDARSDLFSLGVLLYQMLAGVRPFDAETEGDRRATAQRIRRDPPKPLRARVPDVPRPLERIVMRLLEKLPADRYAHASTVADLLDDFVRTAATATSRQLVVHTLIDAGLSKPAAPAAASFDHGAPRRSRLGAAVLGYSVLLSLLVAGGVVLQHGRHDAQAFEGGREAVSPATIGYLRVAATPWAEVSIDGVFVEVTPFARSIPLATGTHYVTLTHPSSVPEKRVVDIAANKTVVLDVWMKVYQKSPAPDGQSAAETESAAPQTPPGTHAPGKVETARGDERPEGVR